MQQREFKTSDMALAAFLITSGLPLEKALVTEDDGKAKVDFVFEWKDRIYSLKTAYFMKQAESRVIAAEYAMNLKNLKNLVHAEMSDWRRQTKGAKNDIQPSQDSE